MQMKISICQFDYAAMALEENKNKILQALQDSDDETLNLFGNMAVTSSPIYNHSLYENLYSKVNKIGDELCNTNKSFIVGVPSKNEVFRYNSLVFVYKGDVKALATKRNLSPLDANFSIGNGMEVVKYRDKKIAFGFYADLDNFLARKVSVDLLILFEDILFDKDYKNEIERELLKTSKQIKTPVILVSRVGAEGNYVYQGGSFFINSHGILQQEMEEFAEQTLKFDTSDADLDKEFAVSPYIERIYNACVVGISDYFEKNHIKKAIIGLSGGIDSAVVAPLAVAALGKENVIGILMPSEYSTDHSVRDAQQSAENLGIEYHIVPIKEIFSASLSTLKDLLSDSVGLAEENLQARIRCMIVMAYANKHKAAMLNTSNKSESCVGYGTLYGDDSGALGPIGDLYKEDVYKLANYINEEKEIVPKNSIEKAPSAELHPGQKDSDSLPDYPLMDKILQLHIEDNLTKEQIINEGFDKQTVEKVLHLFNINEWKRRQEAPALRLSKTCFATDYKLNW